MLSHYLAVALRNARRTPLAFGMNVLTLAVGLLCFVTVYGFVDFWRSADRHFANADRIYAVTTEFEIRDGSFAIGNSGTPEHLADYLRTDFPGIERIVHAVGLGQDAMASAGDRALRPDGAYATGPELFELFDLPFVAGDRRRALSQPRSVVLTAELATQLFGDAEPLGRAVRIGNAVDATVTGVLGPVPEPSHMGRSTSASFRFDLLASLDVLEGIRARARDENAPPPQENWLQGNARTYLLLPADGSLTATTLQAQLADFVARRVPENMQRFVDLRFNVVPVSSLLGDNVEGGMFLEDLDVSVPALLLWLGALVLGVACVNYANLATARAAARGREMGLRKSLGARPGQVMAQALLEAALAALTAIAIAVAGYRLAAPAFAALLGTDPTATLFDGAAFWLFLLALAAGVTFAAGAYPAFVLSRVRPVATLRGAPAARPGGRLPGALVAAQFTVAAFLLIVVTVTALENAHLKRTGLGIAEDPLLVIDNSSRAANVSADTLRAELERLPQVRGVTEMAAPPFLGFSLTVVRSTPEQTGISRTVFSHVVGHDFFDMFDVPLLAGRVFSREHGDMPATPLDAPPPPGTSVRRRNVVVDRSLVEELGLGSPEQAVDRLLYMSGDEQQPPVELHVVGVVETQYFALFNLGTAKSAIYQMSPELPLTLVRLARTDVSGALDAVDALWKRLAPNVAVGREFYDDLFDELYTSYLRISQVISVLALMAVFIAVVGLFGMATLIAGRRRREIGVRKSLGARTPQMIGMLLASFAKPVAIANVIAWPAAYVASRRYLDFFIEPIPLTPLPFLLALGATVAIACAAVGGQTLRAARSRPAEVLRHE